MVKIVAGAADMMVRLFLLPIIQIVLDPLSQNYESGESSSNLRLKPAVDVEDGN